MYHFETKTGQNVPCMNLIFLPRALRQSRSILPNVCTKKNFASTKCRMVLCHFSARSPHRFNSVAATQTFLSKIITYTFPTGPTTCNSGVKEKHGQLSAVSVFEKWRWAVQPRLNSNAGAPELATAIKCLLLSPKNHDGLNNKRSPSVTRGAH